MRDVGGSKSIKKGDRDEREQRGGWGKTKEGGLGQTRMVFNSVFRAEENGVSVEVWRDYESEK